MKLIVLALVSALAGGDSSVPPPVPATPGARIYGVGHFTYDEPGLYGHRIRFSIRARVAADGTTSGVFGYRHLLPEGQVLGAGRAEVTCVSVHGDTALVAAVVPEGSGNVRNHGFYLKIVEGRDPPGPGRAGTPAATLHRHRLGPHPEALPNRTRRVRDPSRLTSAISMNVWRVDDTPNGVLVRDRGVPQVVGATWGTP
jgi:hypothetical protein